MIIQTEPIDMGDLENPDSVNIEEKITIDINLREQEISASGYLNIIDTNYSKQEILVFDDNQSQTKGDVYYTPIYKEKISYDAWKQQINKTFEELGNE